MADDRTIPKLTAREKESLKILREIASARQISIQVKGGELHFIKQGKIIKILPISSLANHQKFRAMMKKKRHDQCPSA